jgi:DNA repair protein RecO (recombination protein O)
VGPGPHPSTFNSQLRFGVLTSFIIQKERLKLPAEQTDALVLRIYPWSETSCIASLYTRGFGKLSVLAKGARRPKSPFEAALDLLSICRVVFIPKSGDALDLLTEAKLVRRFRAGAADLLRLYGGYYVAELLDRLTDKGDEQAELFELADATLSALANPDLELRAIVLRLELQMLRMVGHLPTWHMCAQCGDEVPEAENATFGLLAGGVLCERCRSGSRHMIQLPAQVRETLEQFSEPEWKTIPLTTYPNANRAVLRNVLKQYLTVLLDRKLNLHSYLEELGR